MGDSKKHAMAQMGYIASMMGTLNITGGRLKSLKDALHNFDEAAVVLSQRAESVVDLLRADGPFSQDDAEFICTVQARAAELVRVARLLNDAAIQDIVRQVVSLGGKASFNIGALLEHFKKPIERIAQGVIQEAKSDEILWKTAEECYHQAVRPSGDLNLEKHLAIIVLLQSEEKKDNWVKFWIQSLCNCPGSPTLFRPEDACAFGDSAKRPPKHMTRYLFRAYDANSTGRNDEEVMASISSQHDEANHHRTDIFSMDYQEASEMLHQHLHKGLSGTWVTNNLVSWSSSLIFVIQYANWRFCNSWFSQQNDISICAVDTSKFPRGQFAKDKWLLNCFKHAELSDQENRFRDLRLNEDHNNGEYLSQGFLHISKRSCTLSLRGLIDAGLWNLYPEFNINVERGGGEGHVRTHWPDYAKTLRLQWYIIQKTTKADVNCALHIAEGCFPGFDQDDMALLLLSFRERKLHPEEPSFQDPFADLLSSVSAEGLVYEEPVEVDRYLTLRKRLSKLSEASGERGMKVFEQLYVLEDSDED
ncbi:uncharacterized protein FTJAE_12182 [Fusarium tjaetaba]|uniref:DUF7587 domain-containing protein n=1 Tax=Fusarium tjaetaba TaxID=1567544 RepID=A0A8H5VER0_9HYPO|nr:uncharacterized protein FTJAE_12182 [Fusarium tjaetaba]KAF5618484.1 hypothetical protein FTJAE_12182 [Fusarium tjaetaba]